MSRPELFISIDIETDGPAPGWNSMLALGAAAFDRTGEQVGFWYATLKPLEDARQDDGTMQWWASQPEAWKEVTSNRQDPGRVIPEFADWCEFKSVDHGAKLVAVAWPAAFDFAFVNYYCHRFAGRNPLGFGACDIRSYANGLADHPDYYGIPEKQVREMAGKIDKTGLRPHVAVDDAIEQGRLFMALRKYALSKKAAA
jgi:3'-5' exoribonuclease Rv2179c-like domain